MKRSIGRRGLAKFQNFILSHFKHEGRITEDRIGYLRGEFYRGIGFIKTLGVQLKILKFQSTACRKISGHS